MADLLTGMASAERSPIGPTMMGHNQRSCGQPQSKHKTLAAMLSS